MSNKPSRKKYSDLMIDRLRLDLDYMDPEDHDARWDITKQELAIIADARGPSRVDIGYICLLGGILIGIYGVKLWPKTKFVKQVRYVQEAFKAQRRLTKIMLEEYQRFDEALSSEQTFLDMMGQDLPLDIRLSMTDEDGQRRVHMEFKKRGKSKKDDNGGES